MKSKSERLYWTKVLPENEICMLTILLYDFIGERIDYKKLKEAVLNEGYTISVEAKKPRTDVRTVKALKEIKTRIEKEAFKYSDISSFILTDKDGREIVMKMDINAIKIAALAGDPRAKAALMAIRQAEYSILRGYLPSDKIKNLDDFNQYMDSQQSCVLAGRAAK